MPHTAFERTIALVMLLVAAALVVLALRATRSDDPVSAASPAPAATPTVAAEPVTTASEATPAPVASPKPVARSVAQLTVVATGGDSWLAVRAGSADGRVLYEGVMTEGSGINVKAQRLWVRFGGASNLTAELNGKPLPLREGTYNAVISPTGLAIISG
jgi:hypothetical protein